MNAVSEPEIDRRRAANRRLGWVLGGVAFLLYAIGMFISR
jgi:hypothetical protein